MLPGVKDWIYCESYTWLHICINAELKSADGSLLKTSSGRNPMIFERQSSAQHLILELLQKHETQTIILRDLPVYL